jgi:hypothetical protein
MIIIMNNIIIILYSCIITNKYEKTYTHTHTNTHAHTHTYTQQYITIKIMKLQLQHFFSKLSNREEIDCFIHSILLIHSLF